MCVIAVKPKGVDMIDDQIMRDMWDTNSDGAGFMYLNKEGHVIIDKGYMVFDEFLRSIKNIKDIDDYKETPLIMHFRITTHGGTSPENTHPFPISSKVEHLKALDVKAFMAMAHNGVISSVGREDTLSDTQIFIRDIIAPLSRFTPDFLSKYETFIKYGLGSSKLVFLDDKGTITKFGRWEEKDGIYYSNLNHVRTYKTKTKLTTKSDYSYGSSYDYYDYDYNYNYTPNYYRGIKSNNLKDFKHGAIYVVDTQDKLKVNRVYGVLNGDMLYCEKYYNNVYLTDILTGEECSSVVDMKYLRLAKKSEIDKIADIMHYSLSLSDVTVYDDDTKVDNSLVPVSCNPNERFKNMIFADSGNNKFEMVRLNNLKLKKIRNGIKFYSLGMVNDKEKYTAYETVNDKFYYDIDKKKAYYRDSNKAFVEIKDFIVVSPPHVKYATKDPNSGHFQGTRKFKNVLVTNVLREGV